MIVPILIGGAFLLALVFSSKSTSKGASMPTSPVKGTWGGYEKALKEDPSGVAAVFKALEGIVPPLDLAWIIEIESRWNPAILNTYAPGKSSGAAGLIQMMPSTQKTLGISNVEKMSRAEQAPYIRKYFENNLHGRKLTIPGDYYFVVFSPAFIGHADTDVMYQIGSKAWEQNPGYRSANNGPILVGTVRKKGIPPGMPPSGFPFLGVS